MPNSIDDIVADNRRSLRGTQTRFVSVESKNGLFFGTSFVEATVTTEVQARDEASSSASDWSTVSTSRSSGTVVNGGSQLIAASFDASGDTPGAIAYGTGTADATRFDSSLASLSGTIAQDTATDDGADVVVTSVATNDETIFEGDFEVGVRDSSGNLLTREVYSGPSNITDTDEVRAIVTITLTGSADGQAVYTTVGLNSMAQAVVASSRTVFKAWVFSDTADGVDASDTKIANEVFRNQTTRSVSNTDVEVKCDVGTGDTPNASIPFDIVESGVYDEDQNLVWGSPNATFTVESDTTFVAEKTTRVV